MAVPRQQAMRDYAARVHDAEEAMNSTLPPPPKLNPEQQKAVTAGIDRNLLVQASAGSGKTTVVVERIKHLISKLGVKPYNILVLTFTKMAAQSVTQRITDAGLPARR